MQHLPVAFHSSAMHFWEKVGSVFFMITQWGAEEKNYVPIQFSVFKASQRQILQPFLIWCKAFPVLMVLWCFSNIKVLHITEYFKNWAELTDDLTWPSLYAFTNATLYHDLITLAHSLIFHRCILSSPLDIYKYPHCLWSCFGISLWLMAFHSSKFCHLAQDLGNLRAHIVSKNQNKETECHSPHSAVGIHFPWSYFFCHGSYTNGIYKIVSALWVFFRRTHLEILLH